MTTAGVFATEDEDGWVSMVEGGGQETTRSKTPTRLADCLHVTVLPGLLCAATTRNELTLRLQVCTLSTTTMILTALLGLTVLTFAWVFYNLVVLPLTSPLRNLPGPPSEGWIGLGGHLRSVLRCVTL